MTDCQNIPEIFTLLFLNVYKINCDLVGTIAVRTEISLSTYLIHPFLFAVI